MTFLAKVKTEEQSLLTPQDSKFFGVKQSNFGQYPIGVGPWIELPFADPRWRFQLPQSLDPESQGQLTPPKIQHVMWCYDASTIGALVWVRC